MCYDLDFDIKVTFCSPWLNIWVHTSKSTAYKNKLIDILIKLHLLFDLNLQLSTHYMGVHVLTMTNSL